MDDHASDAPWYVGLVPQISVGTAARRELTGALRLLVDAMQPERSHVLRVELLRTEIQRASSMPGAVVHSEDVHVGDLRPTAATLRPTKVDYDYFDDLDRAVQRLTADSAPDAGHLHNP